MRLVGRGARALATATLRLLPARAALTLEVLACGRRSRWHRGRLTGAMIKAGDREIGHITSSTRSPALQRPIALAYVHRDFLEPGTKVVVGSQSAEVVALPFVS